jgi:hypothetical protein
MRGERERGEGRGERGEGRGESRGEREGKGRGEWGGQPKRTYLFGLWLKNTSLDAHQN